MINEPRENYKLAAEGKNLQTYKKKEEIRNVIILKTYCTIFYPIEQAKQLLYDIPGMDKWEKTYNKHVSVEKKPKDENGLEIEI